MRRTARAVGLSFLFLLIPLPWANAAQAPSLEVSRWSRPVAVIMTRIEARPALVVDRSGRIHLFYLDRDGDRGLVLWVTTDVDGRTAAIRRSRSCGSRHPAMGCVWWGRGSPQAAPAPRIPG